MHRRVRGVTVLWKNFCLTVLRNFVREPFSVSKVSGMKKKLWTGEGERVSRFPSNFFCLTVPKNFVGGVAL